MKASDLQTGASKRSFYVKPLVSHMTVVTFGYKWQLDMADSMLTKNFNLRKFIGYIFSSNKATSDLETILRNIQLSVCFDWDGICN